MTLWLSFIICSSVIVYSGTRLARYGDIIAEKTGLGRAWIGMGLRRHGADICNGSHAALHAEIEGDINNALAPGNS